MNRLIQAREQLLGDSRFAQLIPYLMIGRLEYSNDHATAATNGYDVYFNKSFADTLPDNELAFILAHETVHKIQTIEVYRHSGHPRSIINIALDHVANLMLLDLDPLAATIKMPSSAHCDLKYAKMSTDDVIMELLNNKMVTPVHNFDEHDLTSTLSDEERTNIEIARSITSRMNIMTHDIAIKRNTIDWRSLLVNKLKDIISGHGKGWRPLRRMIYRWTNPYMIHSSNRRSPRSVCVAFDTSGSMSKLYADSASFAINALSNLGARKVVAFCWDTDICGDVHHMRIGEDARKFIERMVFAGGGRTSFVAAEKKIRSLKCDVNIVFTDAMIFDMPDVVGDHLWVLLDNGRPMKQMKHFIRIR